MSDATLTHERVGRALCSCGFDAYQVRRFVLDYPRLLEAHIREANDR